MDRREVIRRMASMVVAPLAALSAVTNRIPFRRTTDFECTIHSQPLATWYVYDGAMFLSCEASGRVVTREVAAVERWC